MQVESLIKTFKQYKENYNIKGSLDHKQFCEALEVDEGELVYLLCYMFVMLCGECARSNERAENLERENEVLNNCINGYIKNKREKQAAMVESGLPIAKNRKKNLSLLDMQINMLGYTDEELLEYYEVSRTTLWRWKKELVEKLDYLKKHKRCKKVLVGNELK